MEARVVKRPNSTAVRRTLEDQKEKADWRIEEGSRRWVAVVLMAATVAIGSWLATIRRN